MIDVAAYTPFLSQLREAGPRPVFIIAPVKTRTPIKIGRSVDVGGALAGVQRLTRAQVGVSFILWTPGHAIAERIETVVALRLSDYQVPGFPKWFKIPADDVAGLITRIARELFRATAFLDHAAIMRKLAGGTPWAEAERAARLSRSTLW